MSKHENHRRPPTVSGQCFPAYPQEVAEICQARRVDWQVDSSSITIFTGHLYLLGPVKETTTVYSCRPQVQWIS